MKKTTIRWMDYENGWVLELFLWNEYVYEVEMSYSRESGYEIIRASDKTLIIEACASFVEELFKGKDRLRYLTSGLLKDKRITLKC